MGRRRDPSRRGWADNLYPCGNGCKYRHPLTKKETWMGTDIERANDSARKLNAILASRTTLIDKVLGSAATVRDAIKLFRAEDMPHRDWAAKTASECEVRLRRIEKDKGAIALAEFGVHATAAYLKTFQKSPRARQQYRILLSWIFACAIQEGWIETNPALMTRRGVAKRKRDRLTETTFTAIRDQAPQWLRYAIDLSRITLLRREEICALRFTDWRDGALWVVPQKTKNSTGVRLRIALGAELEALIAGCRNGVVSPFIIHRLPEKARPRDKRAKAREHHTQVLPEQLSRAFADARASTHLFGANPNPPTFHEVRSYGGKCYRDAGWTLQQVQELMGHESQEMTEVYLEGHEAPWTQISAKRPESPNR